MFYLAFVLAWCIMSEGNINIRPARESDLAAINRVIDAAVMTWDLPERVKRLSMPSYHYTAIDLAHYEILVALEAENIVGVVAWDKEAHPVQQQRGLLLHGIYVQPDKQRQGIGRHLFMLAERAVLQNGMDGLLVKAQKDAEAFYHARGMHKLVVADHDREFANRYWKVIKTTG